MYLFLTARQTQLLKQRCPFLVQTPSKKLLNLERRKFRLLEKLFLEILTEILLALAI